MPERDWWIAVVQLSDSFRVTVAELAGELGAGVIEWRPEPGAALPVGAGVLLLMAGGAEATALELLAEFPAAAAVPRYLVGALPDHRLAAAAVRRGA
ncbi:MAG: hypothetical protein H0W29_10845, partial [Gemmatimonadales bacterium]|nr:hypothetical protein [Gemmatimonadales bacterium]